MFVSGLNERTGLGIMCIASVNNFVVRGTWRRVLKGGGELAGCFYEVLTSSMGAMFVFCSARRGAGDSYEVVGLSPRHY